MSDPDPKNPHLKAGDIPAYMESPPGKLHDDSLLHLANIAKEMKEEKYKIAASQIDKAKNIENLDKTFKEVVENTNGTPEELSSAVHDLQRDNRRVKKLVPESVPESGKFNEMNRIKNDLGFLKDRLDEIGKEK